MPNPTLKMDSVTVLDKDSDGVHFKNSIVHSSTDLKPAFSALDSSASNGPTSGTAVTKNTSLPLFGCRAWVNFDGRSANVDGSNNCAIRASGNVSSVLRTNSGRYTVNFATAMPDANYCVVVTHENIDYGGSSWLTSSAGVTSSSVQVASYDIDGRKYQDTDVMCVVIFR